MSKLLIFQVLFVLFLVSCKSEQITDGSLHSITFSVGDLTATFVDNKAVPPVHRAGYNGIAVLMHKDQPDSIYVPYYAGFNLEHIFSGDSLLQKFEPRRHPMTLSQIAPNVVELYQSPTPLSQVESWTVFTLKPPHYIDVEFKCVIHPSDFFQHGYAGLFWASYIKAPRDIRIHFWGYSQDDKQPHWISAYSEKHGVKSTHISAIDDRELYFAENVAPTFLASHLSEYRFLKPFYYGRFRDMVLIHLFDNERDIRFSQSPAGGGELNPAWDFQFIIEAFEFHKTYSYKARIVYKPFISQDDVVEEFEKWQ